MTIARGYPNGTCVICRSTYWGIGFRFQQQFHNPIMTIHSGQKQRSTIFQCTMIQWHFFHYKPLDYIVMTMGSRYWQWWLRILVQNIQCFLETRKKNPTIYSCCLKFLWFFLSHIMAPLFTLKICCKIVGYVASKMKVNSVVDICIMYGIYSQILMKVVLEYPNCPV